MTKKNIKNACDFLKRASAQEDEHERKKNLREQTKGEKFTIHKFSI